MNGHDRRRKYANKVHVDLDRGRAGDDVADDPEAARLGAPAAFHGPRVRVSVALVVVSILFVLVLLLLAYQLVGTGGGPSQPPPSRITST